MSASSSDDSGVDVQLRRNKRKSSEPRRRRATRRRPDRGTDDSGEDEEGHRRDSVIREAPAGKLATAADEDLGLDLTTTSSSPATSASSGVACSADADDECLDLRALAPPPCSSAAYDARDGGLALFTSRTDLHPRRDAVASVSGARGAPKAACRKPSEKRPSHVLLEPPEELPRFSRLPPVPFDASDVELIPRTSSADGVSRPAQRNYKGMTRQRRIEANARERSRVHTISAAFEALRRAVPAYADNQKLSKLAILRIAAAYIVALARLNDQDYSRDRRAPSFAECIDLCTRTIQAEGRARRRSTTSTAKDSADLSS
ncbi:protein atonal homolog 8 [Ixodes scapularis]|uniref:protein atonal homolog 8 n=1 Tax=Ixodes scapularis TaxID=6945 RepID=UPI001C38E4CC|nr:protein atonal homolog 8 [Ixodes scapularis]